METVRLDQAGSRAASGSLRSAVWRHETRAATQPNDPALNNTRGQIDISPPPRSNELTSTMHVTPPERTRHAFGTAQEREPGTKRVQDPFLSESAA